MILTTRFTPTTAAPTAPDGWRSPAAPPPTATCRARATPHSRRAPPRYRHHGPHNRRSVCHSGSGPQSRTTIPIPPRPTLLDRPAVAPTRHAPISRYPASRPRAPECPRARPNRVQGPKNPPQSHDSPSGAEHRKTALSRAFARLAIRPNARIACHAGGRGFESRRSRRNEKPRSRGAFFVPGSVVRLHLARRPRPNSVEADQERCRTRSYVSAPATRCRTYGRSSSFSCPFAGPANKVHSSGETPSRVRVPQVVGSACSRPAALNGAYSPGAPVVDVDPAAGGCRDEDALRLGELVDRVNDLRAQRHASAGSNRCGCPEPSGRRSRPTNLVRHALSPDHPSDDTELARSRPRSASATRTGATCTTRSSPRCPTPRCGHPTPRGLPHRRSPHHLRRQPNRTPHGDPLTSKGTSQPGSARLKSSPTVAVVT